MAKIEVSVDTSALRELIDFSDERILADVAARFLSLYREKMIYDVSQGYSPVDGSDFGSYSEMAEDFRRDLGLQTDYVDLNVSGGVSNSFVDILSDSAQLYFEGSSYSGANRGSVMYTQEQRYGYDIFPDTESELSDELIEALEDLIINHFE